MKKDPENHVVADMIRHSEPPLLPGVERRISGSLLLIERTKGAIERLREWAATNGATVEIDYGVRKASKEQAVRAGIVTIKRIGKGRA